MNEYGTISYIWHAGQSVSFGFIYRSHRDQ
jgi:hypothetical protein